MSDERLRELARRWKESGSPEDGAAYLLARVRAGDLSQERLRLAAYCGDQAAALALGEPPPPADTGLRRWFIGLERWGKPALVRAAVAAARLAISSWKHEVDPEVLQGVRAAEAWLECPCDTHAAEAKEAAYGARFVVSQARETHGNDVMTLDAANCAARAAARTLRPDDPPDAAEHLAMGEAWTAAYAAGGGDPLVHLPAILNGEETFYREAPEAPRQSVVMDRVRSALRAWALEGRST